MDERLRYFKTVVDAHGITEAARQLHISQPALSIALAKLERELKAVLIHRGVNHFRVTEAGWLVHAFAAEHAARLDGLRQDLARQRGERLSLRIGMIDSMADILTTGALLPELERRYQVSLTVDSSSRLLQAVRLQQLDYALIVMDEAAAALSGDKLSCRFIGDEPLLDVWSNRGKRVDRLIAYNQASSTFGVIEAAFRVVKRPFEPAMYSTSPTTMLQLVRQGRGHAALPYPMVKDGLNNAELRLLAIGRDGFARRPIRLVSLREHDSMPMVRTALGDVLEQYIAGAEALVRPLFED